MPSNGDLLREESTPQALIAAWLDCVLQDARTEMAIPGAEWKNSLVKSMG
jgi:hypothetical protein